MTFRRFGEDETFQQAFLMNKTFPGIQSNKCTDVCVEKYHVPLSVKDSGDKMLSANALLADIACD
jgi:hypothetical protein